jgi:hypothetical protein
MPPARHTLGALPPGAGRAKETKQINRDELSERRAEQTIISQFAAST